MTQQETEVLILGAGIAGCSAAYALQKKGVSVTLVAGAQNMQHTDSFGEQEGIIYPEKGASYEQLTHDLQQAAGGGAYSRAVEHLLSNGSRLIPEFLINELGISFDHTNEGEKSWYQEEGHSEARILRCGDNTGQKILASLLEKLRKSPHIRMVEGHAVIELITLAEHSEKSSDRYKKPACLGAYIKNLQSGEVTTICAKETILATGGVGNLFLYTTSYDRGEGIALAASAGARILQLDSLQLHPMAYLLPGPVQQQIPDAFRFRGGEILSKNGISFLENWLEKGIRGPKALVAEAVYNELFASGSSHLWLNLQNADLAWLQVKYPTLFQIWKERGIDVTKDLIPIVPAVNGSNGGVFVDRVGATTVHRLRAVGQVACTGLHGSCRLPGVSILESLVWGITSGEDIAKEIQKFAYYFPPLVKTAEFSVTDIVREQQDWQSMRQTLWNFVGSSSENRRRRAQATLRELEWEVDELLQKGEDVRSLRNSLKTALLLTS